MTKIREIFSTGRMFSVGKTTTVQSVGVSLQVILDKVCY